MVRQVRQAVQLLQGIEANIDAMAADFANDSATLTWY